MWGILCASAQVLANPAGERHEAVIACGVLLGIRSRGLVDARDGSRSGCSSWRGRKAAKLLLVSLGFGLVPAALVERGCRLLTDWHVLKYHQAIQTVWRAGHDDWRLATITGDENREPDPVLLWRPVTHSPFNAQRFKGPLAEIPKPADVFRVMCYGDSLTDGPPRGAGRPGCTGCSRRAAAAPEPPIRSLERGRGGVLIAPGRAAIPAGSRPLSTRPRPGLVRLERRGRGHRPAGQDVQDSSLARGRVPAGTGALSGLSCAHVLHAKVASRAAGGCAGPVSPRVSVADYLANMDRFRTEAARRGIRSRS